MNTSTEHQQQDGPVPEPNPEWNPANPSTDGTPYSARNERVLPWKLEQSIPERFRHRRLDDLGPLPEGIREYCEDLQGIRSGNGLIIIGPTGTGKTTLAVAILNEIAANAHRQNLTVKWETFARFITAHDLADISLDFDGDEYLQHKKIKLLIIDDIGPSRLTDFGETELASLFDYRYAALLPTIITSNLDAPAFKAYMGERSLSRFVECSRMIKLLGPDRRLPPPDPERTSSEPSRP